MSSVWWDARWWSAARRSAGLCGWASRRCPSTSRALWRSQRPGRASQQPHPRVGDPPVHLLRLTVSRLPAVAVLSAVLEPPLRSANHALGCAHPCGDVRSHRTTRAGAGCHERLDHFPLAPRPVCDVPLASRAEARVVARQVGMPGDLAHIQSCAHGLIVPPMSNCYASARFPVT